MKIKLIVFFIIFFIIGCKKDSKIEQPQVTPTVNSGIIEFNITAKINNQNLIYNSQMYKGNVTDSFKVSLLKYYLSNFKLKDVNNNELKINEYVINEHNTSTISFTLNNVAPGNYNTLNMLIGVDKEHNISGSQTGALDPINGMFWDWNTGYIFFKLEGEYKNSNSSALKPITIHIGGFDGPFNCLREANINSIDLKVVNDKKTVVNMDLNLNELLNNPQVLEFDNIAISSTSKDTKIIADNYFDMFSVTSIINP
jgi:hypothetical protein